MKKSLIALAVAGALTVPMVAQADATLYGSVRLKLNSSDNGELDVKDNSSRVGIKGSTELFSGNKAIFQGEWKVGNNDDAGFGDGRLWYAGVTGDFGTATIGQQWTPHYNWTGATTDIGDNSITGGTQAIFRSGNTVAYISPNLGGFQAAGVIIADDNTDGEDVDGYNLAATFSAGGFAAGASILTNEITNNDITAVAASYSADALYVGARFENNEGLAANTEDRFELAASYAMGSTKFIGQYNDFDDAGSEFALEVQQKLGKKARIFAAYIDQDDDRGDNDQVEVGYRVDF